MSDFKSKYTLDTRKTISSQIREKHPDHIPMIMISGKAVSLRDERMNIPKSCKMEKFIDEIRKRNHLAPEQAMFFFFQNVLTSHPHLTMAEIDSRYRDEDGFLYCTITKENVFG